MKRKRLVAVSLLVVAIIAILSLHVFRASRTDVISGADVLGLLRAVQKRDDPLQKGYRRIWPALPSALRRRVERPIDPTIVRSNAAFTLMRDGDPKILAPLLTTHYDPVVRYLAANGMFQVNTPEATGALVVALDDADSKVRSAAIWALAFPERDQRVVRTAWIRALTNQDPEIRDLAITGLDAFSTDTDSKPILMQLQNALASNDVSLSNFAAKVLLSYGRNELLPSHNSAGNQLFPQQ